MTDTSQDSEVEHDSEIFCSECGLSGSYYEDPEWVNTREDSTGALVLMESKHSDGLTCLDCEETLDSLDVRLPRRRVFFSGVKYLGGFPEQLQMFQARPNFIVDEHGLHLRTSKTRRHVVRWNGISGLTVDGGEVTKSKIAPAILFGILGAVAVRGTKDRAFLAVRREDGATAHFMFDNVNPQVLRAKLAPVLFKVGVPFLDEPATPASISPAEVGVVRSSVADELAKLAGLHQQGVLTDDEFEKAKRTILDQL